MLCMHAVHMQHVHSSIAQLYVYVIYEMCYALEPSLFAKLISPS